MRVRVPPPAPRRIRLLARTELVARRDLRRRLADDDRDFLVRLEDHVLRVPGLLLSVHVPLQPVAVRPDATGVEEDAPLGDELAEAELVVLLRRLDMDDASRVVRVQLG